MATQELTGALNSVDHGDTSPLPPAAEAALARLDRAFLPLTVVKAMTRYEVAAARYDELIARPASDLSPAEFDSIGLAQQTLAESFGVLAEAGRTDLVESAVVARVGAALGFKAGWKPDPYFDETATHLTVWSQVELNEIFERAGGTVTTRQVERTTLEGDPTWTATEITLTVDVDGVGPVEIVTDIEDDPEHGYRTDIPVVAVANYRASEARANELIALGRTGSMTDLDADDLAHNVDLMAGYRATLAAAGRLDLIQAAS